MDNQNTNGVNGNNLEQLNNPIPTPDLSPNTLNNGIPIPNKENEEGNGTIPPLTNSFNNGILYNESTNLNDQVESITPVKPTLDAILNGNNEEVVKASFNNNEPISIQNNVAPTIETIDEAVVDTSAQRTASNGNSILNELPIYESIPTSNPSGFNNVQPNVGSIQTAPVIESIEEVPSFEQVETLNNEEQVEPLVSEETVMPNLEPPKMESSGQKPIDDFNEVPVPPVFEEKNIKSKNKKGSYQGLIVILIIILIAAIGFGVYYFLKLAKTSVPASSIVTKEVRLELGSTLPTNISEYATISGYKESDCTLNLDNININKVSTYKYSITCGKNSEEGTVIVDDSISPEVITNDLVLLPNANLKAEDFIEKCIDASKCSYEFATDITSVINTVGEHTIEIIASDEYNNKSTVSAKLTISRNAPVRYLTCKKSEEIVEDINAKLVDSYKIGIDLNDNFFNAVRNSEFMFLTQNDYQSVKNSYNETVGIYNRIGNATFIDSSQLISLKANKTLSDMNNELNGSLPSNTNILRAYLSGLGYICS